MTRIAIPFAVLTTTLAFAVPAQAALTRTFVSAAGSDSNPCTITQPCATFAHAYSVTAASGIIAALDPGKYGPVTITGPVTINGNGWAAITAPATGSGITINAGSTDKVALIGLEIDGAGAGYEGINFQSGGSLTVTNCTLQNFISDGGLDLTTGSGIVMQPTSGTPEFTITNTTASNNGSAGILYQPASGSPTAKAVIDHVVASSNRDGIDLLMGAASGGGAVVTLSNSIASDNTIGGVSAGTGASPATLTLSIDNLSASGNADGVAAGQNANVLLGRSVITGNGVGVQNNTSPNVFYTYKDNRINLNTGADISGALNTTFATQ